MTTSEQKPITLYQTEPPVSIERENVYFAFGSGRLDYDCVRCNAKCCRGHGFRVQVGAEFEIVQKMRPNVSLFLDFEPTGNPRSYQIANCPPECFFLSADGRCEIHAHHGADAKPETCRLFPFNNIQRAGRFLIVRPHPYLCPIDIMPPESKSEKSKYENLFHAMGIRGITAQLEEVESHELDVARAISLERHIVEMVEKVIKSGGCYVKVASAQLVATAAAQTGADWTAEPQSTVDDLNHFVTMICKVLGTEVPATDDDQLVRTMCALTPFLRSLLVFENAGVTSRRMRFPLQRVPHALLATYIIASLSRAAGMRNITFQSITQIFGKYERLIRILAHANCPMVLVPGAILNIPISHSVQFQIRYIKILKALMLFRQRKRRVVLGTILSENSEATGLNRIMFLKLVSDRLSGCVAPLSGTRGSMLRSFTCWLQRLAITVCHAESLGVVLHKKATKERLKR